VNKTGMNKKQYLNEENITENLLPSKKHGKKLKELERPLKNIGRFSR